MKQQTTLTFDGQTLDTLKRIAFRNHLDTIQAAIVFAVPMFKDAHPTEYEHTLSEYRQAALTRYGQPRDPGKLWFNVMLNRKGPIIPELYQMSLRAGMPFSPFLALMTITYAEQFPEEFTRRAQLFLNKERDRRKAERALARESKLVPPTEPIAVTADGLPIFSDAKSRHNDS